jgi:hypothetical protein
VLLWREYRDLLATDDDRLADPVAYSLWVDFFEDPETVGEAWRELTLDEDERRLTRLLSVSGPVPWSLKAPLFERLAPDRRWHEPIVRALGGVAFDVYGDIDEHSAANLLSQLDPPPDLPGLADLRRRLDRA